MDMPPTSAPILTPSTLNQLVRELLGDALPLIWIEGELSNVARPASGHLYFTLKDSGAQVRCAMFRPKSSWLCFKPVDGMQVLLRARVGLYEPRGEFQLIAEHLELAGDGALQRQFEQLKAKLDAEGLFDPDHKRPLPRFAQHIGVITSATGAAIRDVLSVLERRWPLAMVEVLPVPVQGQEAPPQITAMLCKAAGSGRYDVLLLTRGGGSLEDLMAFNDEALARAIHASPVPIISAIGHEIDFTIADLVADLRAPTPSAAAELLVPDSQAIARQLEHCLQRLRLLAQRRRQSLSQRLDHLNARLAVQHPQARLQRRREQLLATQQRLRNAIMATLQRQHFLQEHLRARWLANSPRWRLTQLQQGLQTQRHRLRQAFMQRLAGLRLQLERHGRTLHALSPLATLARGYAILSDTQHCVMRSVTQAETGMRIRARLQDGILTAQVCDTQPLIPELP